MLLLLSLSVSVFTVVHDYFWFRSEKIAYHVSFCGEDLSGVSGEQAKRMIHSKVKERSNDLLTLEYGDQSFEYRCAEMGFPLDGTALYAVAENIGREERLVDRISFRWHSLFHEIKLENHIEVNKEKLEIVVHSVRDQLDTTAKNAYFSVADDGSISIVPSQKGSYLDEEKTSIGICAAMTDFYSKTFSLIVDQNSDPAQTTEDLKKMQINGALSTFTTYYSESAVNRARNISLAASRINGYIVGPGQSFSFNNAVGPRDYEHGFLDAVIIENGKYTNGLGGGVCQVSTTVYGAVLRTELEVTARRPHSLVSGYVDPGQDAMVAWGISDLVFINTYETPILIYTKSGGGALTVSIYGDITKKKDVSVTSKIIRYIPYQTEMIIDSDLPNGSAYVRSSGKRGLECSVHRTVSYQGEVLKSETISHDIYAAQKKIVVSGP